MSDHPHHNPWLELDNEDLSEDQDSQPCPVNWSDLYSHRQQQQQQPPQQQYPQQPQQQQQQQQQVQQQQQQQPYQQQQDNSNNNNGNRPKRNPFCSRCRNHGKSAQVKGHKRHCEYRDCQCEGCKLVECRQIVSAAQIRRRRYQKQDEECGRRIEISPPVLKREPANDPVSLIAKACVVGPTSAMKHHIRHHPYLSHPITHQQVAASAAAPHHSQVQLPPAAAVAASLPSALQQQLQPSLATPGAKSVGTTFTAGSLSLPLSISSSFVSSINAANTVARSLDSPVATSEGPMPLNVGEQLNIVEDIYHFYGPMAIYAWLKAERFDLQKVRYLIEKSRASFSTLSIGGKTANSMHENSTDNSKSNNIIPLDLTSPIVD